MRRRRAKIPLSKRIFPHGLWDYHGWLRLCVTNSEPKFTPSFILPTTVHLSPSTTFPRTPPKPPPHLPPRCTPPRKNASKIASKKHAPQCPSPLHFGRVEKIVYDGAIGNLSTSPPNDGRFHEHSGSCLYRHLCPLSTKQRRCTGGSRHQNRSGHMVRRVRPVL